MRIVRTTAALLCLTCASAPAAAQDWTAQPLETGRHMTLRAESSATYFQQTATRPVWVATTVTALTGPAARSGLLLRDGDGPGDVGSIGLTINAAGDVRLAHRMGRDDPSHERVLATVELPVRLCLARSKGRVVAAYSDLQDHWRIVPLGEEHTPADLTHVGVWLSARGVVTLADTRYASAAWHPGTIAPRRTASGARLTLDRQYGDHMVLQRDVAVPISGTGPIGGPVRVTLGDATAETRTDENGRWRATLPALPAGGPFTLEVHGAGGDEVVLRDVLVGDVWVASGQSNMEWPLRLTGDAEHWIDAARGHDRIRFFAGVHDLCPLPLPEPRAGAWQTGADARNWSGVAFHFAEQIEESVDVPVGIVQEAWGGSAIRSWRPVAGDDFAGRSPDFVSADPLLREARNRELTDRWDKAFAAAMDLPEEERASWAAGRMTDGAVQIAAPPAWESSAGAFDGVAWLWQEVTLPDGWAAGETTLELGPIDDFDRTYVNGTLIGQTGREVARPHAHPRRYTIAAGTLKPGANVIAIQVLDQVGAGGLGATPGSIVLRNESGAEHRLGPQWWFRPQRDLGPRNMPSLPSNGEPNFRARSGMYNAMMHPWQRVPVRGVLWYQGESDASRAAAYAGDFREMITAWRSGWNDDDLPFYFVQLANFMQRASQPRESDWAELRVAQASVLDLPLTGMATAIDIGDADDIHPRNKREVGRRLALLARAQVYGHDVDAYGPRLVSATRSGDEVLLTFDEPLHAGDEGDIDAAFALRGAAGVFTWARARIDGDRVHLQADGVATPQVVRYAWGDNPATPLTDAGGLPVCPFESPVEDER